jgi:parvulin-like peptidyl-prolyl isomerase
MLCLYPKE